MQGATQLIRFDWFIKRMLRDKADYKVLEGFLIALLKKDIAIVSILESEGNQENESDKYNRVDVMVEDDKKQLLWCGLFYIRPGIAAFLLKTKNTNWNLNKKVMRI